MSPTPDADVGAQPKSALAMMKQYFLDFAVLRETKREYWGIQLINVLDCTAYFGIITIGTLFLSKEIGLSDAYAGYVLAAFTSLVVIFLTVSGTVTDWLGVRLSLRASLLVTLLLRAGTAYVGLTPGFPHRGIVTAVLIVLMAPFTASIQTVYQAACNRFTTKRSRSAGFNLWYLFVNLGGALSGYSIDVVRLQLKISNAHIFTMGAVLAALCLVVSELMIRDETQEVGPGEEPEAPVEKKGKQSPWIIFRNVVTEKAFARLMVLITLILGVRAVYAYVYLIMPKYWERTIGADAQIGVLNMINPIGIVVGLILFIPLANRFSVFSMLIYGAIISSVALFPMALPWTAYGSSISQAHYLMAFLCMVILTIGEVLWSPKLYEYTAAIAPKGQEGTYLGLSMIPWFLAKTLVGALSGHLLMRWSPEKVEVGGLQLSLQDALKTGQLPYWQTPSAMWFILGLYALSGCVIALLLRNWLTEGARWKRN